MASVRKRQTADGSRCYDVVYRDLDRRQRWKTHRGRSTPTHSRTRWRRQAPRLVHRREVIVKAYRETWLTAGADARPEHQGSRRGALPPAATEVYSRWVGPHDRGCPTSTSWPASTPSGPAGTDHAGQQGAPRRCVQHVCVAVRQGEHVAAAAGWTRFAGTREARAAHHSGRQSRGRDTRHTGPRQTASCRSDV